MFKAGFPAFVEKAASEEKPPSSPKGETTACQGNLFYGFTVNGDEVFCREGYTDAEGFLAHLDNIGVAGRGTNGSTSPEAKPETSDEATVGPAITLFYNFDGTFTGWIKATRVSDTAGGHEMLFQDELNRVLMLTPGLQVGKVERFTYPDTTAAPPEKLFPDLRLGFFKSGKKLVLALW